MAALQRFLDAHSTVSRRADRGLLARTAVSICGDASRVRALLRAMMCQLAVMHSPATVLIAATVSDRSRPDWEWLKWLPHNRHPHASDDVGPARMVYASLPAAREALDRCDGSGERPTVPHLIVVVDGECDDPTLPVNGMTLLTIEAGTATRWSSRHRAKTLSHIPIG